MPVPAVVTLSRQELYDRVWAEPVQRVAAKLGISDVALAKICKRHQIPVPPRGYWAKLQAGKSVDRLSLPKRALGQRDLVHFGYRASSYDRESDAEILITPIPPPPTFEPDMETVRSQAEALVRRVAFPLNHTHGWHSQIAKLLSADEERARKQRDSPYPSSWDGPVCDNPFERRRLRILNALFTGLTRGGMTPHVSGKHGRDLSVTVGDMHVPFDLDAIGAAKLIERERSGYGFIARGDKDRMQLCLLRWWRRDPDAPSWEDKEGDRLEGRLREIAAAIIVFAEQQLRTNAAHAHEARIERKAELEEAERKRVAEEERRRRERQARREQARVNHLLGQANALHQAQQIRAYVSAVRAINASVSMPMTSKELDEWSTWALAQADRIDPVASGAYKTRPTESGE